MKNDAISGLLVDFLNDLREPGLLGQIATLVLCLSVGWAIARVVRNRLTAHDMQLRVMRLGMESFARVLSPLVSLALISIAKPLLGQYQHVNLLKVAIPLVGSFALIRLSFYVLHRIFVRGGKAGAFVLIFEKAFATLVWLGVALYITGWWPELLQYLDDTVLPVGRHKVSLLTMLQAAVSVLVTLVIALWAAATLEERLMRMESVHSSLRVVMARMGRAVFILVAVLISLSLVGIDLTVLSVFGGALGVGLGLGLQKIVSSYVSGFVILLERSLAIGDLVTIDKYSGQVTQINTRYTVVRGPEGVETVIPNEMLLSGPVLNYSLTDKILRLFTRVTVGYETDIDLVLRLMEEVAAGIPRVSSSPAPQAYLIKFEADGLELELGFWISDPENGRTNVLSDVNRAIWKMLQENQIQVPYPQREVRLIDLPAESEHRISKVVRATETS
ncbi:MAG TPA: mechanosensitive ion channel domain-containing protein [Noviherbaspirillum sp.]|uniref:mechanosensitive ion channel family protein n=1 Tax=Noviherbaspirillum sp. TaxID=1926288 RepID=UPI002B459B7D|nr:mechanosensitive ion channel domain-containing protein [Noviherbaspirillum sp.]HJV86837.1 mechanosensitive ion channel domain-containing protein [Noviherbaspirillum sp.]